MQLQFLGATLVNKVDDSKALSARRGPMAIISASGMAAGGRAAHHLKAFPPDRRDTTLFARYQAGGTRGAAMLNGAASVRIHGEEVPVGAEVASLPNLSAHADAGEILAWMRGFEHELGGPARVPDDLQTVEPA